MANGQILRGTLRARPTKQKTIELSSQKDVFNSALSMPSTADQTGPSTPEESTNRTHIVFNCNDFNR
jgi:hypothetical protein